MSKEAFIKELRELVDQIEALPELVGTPRVEIHLHNLNTIEQLRAARRLMRAPKHHTSKGFHWIDCRERDGIQVAAFYAPGLLGPAVRERVVEVVVESTHDLSVLD